MITLYTRPLCGFCDTVKERLEELAIPYKEKSIDTEDNLVELMEKGGRRQVPYLVDDERGAAIYESAGIIQYLESLRA